MLPDLRTSRPDVRGDGILGIYDVAVAVSCPLLDQHRWEQGMNPAAARYRIVVAVAAEKVRHIQAAAAVGVGEHRTLVAAVIAEGYSIDLGLGSGRFVNVEGMMAVVDYNMALSLFVGYFAGSGHRMTVVGCSRCLYLVRAGCLLGKTRLLLAPYILVCFDCSLVDRMKEALVLYIHHGVARSHCTQSYFATSFLVGKNQQS